MTVRALLAAALTAELPATWRVIAWADSLDRVDPNRPVVMLYRNRVTPTNAGFKTREHEITVWLLEPRANPGAADDALDANLDRLLEAVDTIPGVRWTEAERGVWAEAFHGYKLTTFLITSQKENTP